MEEKHRVNCFQLFNLLQKTIHKDIFFLRIIKVHRLECNRILAIQLMF
uniref:Uncharacterized protein n=1 Tax=Meloidogyne enterolobii TaxID=390850 RepID=A0A6V7XSL2_MELEN|nr:unnamed protein product [Meloidogyne enterolobii]